MKIRRIEDLFALPTPSQVPLGGILTNVGNSVKYNTGTWRTQRPIHNAEVCTNCLICWINCPDGSIMVSEGKVTGIDQMHCKGCGICAQVCPTKPTKAITMAQGGEY
ncbi:MAG: 4Fe-4S binding protein [Dehalococcoidales bacterium]|nr:4Fe-4S binding protein [Dehalococcoidales bacterium]